MYPNASSLNSFIGKLKSLEELRVLISLCWNLCLGIYSEESALEIILRDASTVYTSLPVAHVLKSCENLKNRNR